MIGPLHALCLASLLLAAPSHGATAAETTTLSRVVDGKADQGLIDAPAWNQKDGWIEGTGADNYLLANAALGQGDFRIDARLRMIGQHHSAAHFLLGDGCFGFETWSPLREASLLIEPVCQGSLFRLSDPLDDCRSRILCANPASQAGSRNGTVRLSYDEGETWPVSRVLYPGAFAYSPHEQFASGNEQQQASKYRQASFDDTHTRKPIQLGIVVRLARTDSANIVASGSA